MNATRRLLVVRTQRRRRLGSGVRLQVAWLMKKRLGVVNPRSAADAQLGPRDVNEPCQAPFDSGHTTPVRKQSP